MRSYPITVVIVVPTYNEAKNIKRVILGLQNAFIDAMFIWIVLVINDGDDETADIVNQLRAEGRQWLYIITREGKYPEPGLSGAMKLGLNVAIREFDTEFVVFMDGDGQHPPQSVRLMVDKAIQEKKWGIIVSTRYQGVGSSAGLSSPLRRLYSKIFGWLPRILFARKLWGVTDPLTGFLLVRTSVVHVNRVKAIGWKFGLELIITSDPTPITELEYHFEERLGGESKANARVAFQYLRHLASLFWRYYFG